MHYLKTILIISCLILSMLTSAWAKLEMCNMNNANIEHTADIISDCHIDEQTVPDNTNHHCNNCYHCISVIHNQDLEIITSLYPRQDYTDYHRYYAPHAMFFDTPPPRYSYL